MKLDYSEIQSSGSSKDIVVYTAIFGERDEPQPFKKQQGVDYYAFTDNPDLHYEPFTLIYAPDLQKSPRRNSRYYKMLSTRIFPNYKYSLWLDANIVVEDPDLKAKVKKYLNDSDLAIYHHPVRNCIYREAEVCLEHRMDTAERINAQMEKYRSEDYPENNGLVSTSIIFRRHTPRVAAFNELWWKELNENSQRDQLCFNYAAWKLGFTYNLIPGHVRKGNAEGFSIIPHKGDPPKPMRAVVLTFDRNAALTEHMIRCYNDLWPDHPFIFRIPYQEPSRCIQDDRREYIKTSPEIKKTVLNLLEGLPDDEWIYWSIDDRFPVRLDINPIKMLMNRIDRLKFEAMSGLMFCRFGMMKSQNQLSGEEHLIDNELFPLRKNYHRIWVPQFVKVKVIRHMFLNFPDEIPYAKMMDVYKDNLPRPLEHKLYSTHYELAEFAESTARGKLTEDCLISMQKKAMPLPEWYDGTLTNEHYRRVFA